MMFVVFAVLLGRSCVAGRIPDWLGQLSHLISVNLSNNRFTGHIPESIGTCHSLQSLYVQQNRLSGQLRQFELPACSLRRCARG